MSDAEKKICGRILLLYVEDEPATRDQVSRMLSSRGYRLTVAENGEQGLALFREQHPDIVLTDIMMPRLNGLEMARAIRGLSPQAQIICMTAFSDTRYLIDAIDVGVNQFVLKPVDSQRLFIALDRCREMVEARRRQNILEAENLRAKKMEAIAVLAGGMAHDFNNLLQGILGNVALARINAEPGSRVESLLAIAESSSINARELGSRLLSFAKGGNASMEPLRIAPLIQEKVLAEIATSHAISVNTTIASGLGDILMDAAQMSMVISSILENACEAMPHGGLLNIRVSSTALPESNTYGILPGAYQLVSFEDNGVGIPEENLPKIFDPYFSTKEVSTQKGMGLGLALCHSIIKHHRGCIHAESEPGRGTAIHIHLPEFHNGGAAA